MSVDKFQITYEVNDGYVGPSAPHYTSFRSDDLNGDESDEELKQMFWDEIQRDFNETITPYSKQEDEFVAWAKKLRIDHEV